MPLIALIGLTENEIKVYLRLKRLTMVDAQQWDTARLNKDEESWWLLEQLEGRIQNMRLENDALRDSLQLQHSLESQSEHHTHTPN